MDVAQLSICHFYIHYNTLFEINYALQPWLKAIMPYSVMRWEAEGHIFEVELIVRRDEMVWDQLQWI